MAYYLNAYQDFMNEVCSRCREARKQHRHSALEYYCIHDGFIYASRTFLTTPKNCSDDLPETVRNPQIIPENKPKSRECPCGIFRGDCDYHKD